MVGATLCGLFSAPLTAAPAVAFPPPQCTPFPVPGGNARICVQQNAQGFNAVADVVTTETVFVQTFLEQCRGDGTACGNVGDPGQAFVTNHGFVPTSIVTGAHGHSYRGRVFIDRVPPGTTSPFIAFP
jgi:hypothetical protein